MMNDKTPPAPASASPPAPGPAASAAEETRINRLKRFAAIASVSVAAILIAAKAGAWLATGAVSLLSTLMDSLLDLAASVVNLIAVHHAAQPADREHRFGHGKAEPLAGLAQAAFIAGSAAFLLFQAGERLIRPAVITNSDVGVGVMLVSIALTFGLVLFQRSVVRRTSSVAIRSDSLHYQTDLLINLGVIVALFLSGRFGWPAADPLIAIGIAGYIIFSVVEILKHSLAMLMDRELPDAERERIRAIARAHPGVVAVHDLRTRSSGTQAFIQFHLEMEGAITLLEAHAIAEAVMADVQAAFPHAEVLIHEDPAGIDEPRAVFT